MYVHLYTFEEKLVAPYTYTRSKISLAPHLVGEEQQRGGGVAHVRAHPQHLQEKEWWVQGSGFRVQGPGYRVQGAGYRVWASGCRV